MTRDLLAVKIAGPRSLSDTPEERVLALMELQRLAEEARRAGRASRG